MKIICIGRNYAAQPPIKAEHKSSTGKKSGQRAMLSVVNPAVVAIDTTWKNAWLIVISAEL